MINYKFECDVTLQNGIKKMYIIHNCLHDNDIPCTKYDYKILVDNEEEIENYCNKLNERLNTMTGGNE